jgi:hypothetical protein
LNAAAAELTKTIDEHGHQFSGYAIEGSVSSQPMPPRFLNLDNVLSRELLLPRVEGLVKRANPMDWTSTAATAAVLTVGALGAITVVAQAIATGAPPIPFPVALGTVPGADQAPGARLPAIEVLAPGQHLNFPTMRVSTASVGGSQFSSKAADYHQWSAPHLPDGPRNTGRHATTGPVHQSSGQHQRGSGGGRHAGGGGRHRANPGGGGYGGGRGGGGHGGSHGGGGSGHGGGHGGGGHGGGGHGGGGHGGGGHGGGGH